MTSDLRIAPVRRRLAAFGIDYLILSVYLVVLVALGVTLGRRTGIEVIFAEPFRAQMFGLATLTLPVLLYFALSEGSRAQATLGKRALGLRVASVGGGRLSWGRSLLRSVVKFAPWEIAHTCLWRIPGWPDAVETIPAGVVAGLAAVWLLVGLYLLTPRTSPLRQTPYDRLARSVVLERPRPIDPPGRWKRGRH